MKVIFSLCLILLAIKKNSSAMAKESNSESGGDAKRMYVVNKKEKINKHVPAGKIWGKCLFGHVCYAVCADEDESYIFTYIICICVYIYEGTYI